MQFAKDSFYAALRERIRGVNPGRTIRVDGVERAAIFTKENEPTSVRGLQDDSFYVRWGACRPVPRHGTGGRQLQALECVITYRTRGTCASAVDRGRVLGALDSELMSICHPAETRKRDFTQSPSLDLGSNIFWSEPEFGELETDDASELSAASGGAYLQRSAQLVVFFFPEMEFL